MAFKSIITPQPHAGCGKLTLAKSVPYSLGNHRQSHIHT